MTPDGLRLSHGIKMVLTARALTFLISYIGFNTGQGNRFTKLRKMWSYVGLMEPVLLEIERAMAAGLWYAAVALSLTLPDSAPLLRRGQMRVPMVKKHGTKVGSTRISRGK
jgi:hypothetical protein